MSTGCAGADETITREDTTMNLYDNEIRNNLCNALKASCYRDSSSNSTRDAQANLSGRTHYVDSDTLRYHRARIVGAMPLLNGTFYRLVERTALDYQNTQRGTRVVVFDLIGETVFRPRLDECRATTIAARLDFDRWWTGFDPVEHYRALLARRADECLRQAESLRATLSQFTAQQVAA
jgi:hypothetical protein